MTKSLDFRLFLFFGLTFLLTLFFGLIQNQVAWVFVAPALLFTYWVLADLKQVYFLLLFSLPLCIEFEVGGGFATDLPSEPLMVVLMFATIFYLLLHPTKIAKGFFKHDIFLILFLHVVWIGISAINSVDGFVSFKYFLAKSWYLIVFTLLIAIFIRSEEDFKKVFWLIFIPLGALACLVLYKHWQTGFDFSMVNKISGLGCNLVCDRV